MKGMVLHLSLALFVCSSAFGLEVADLVGTWDVTARWDMEDGVEAEVRERVVYDEGGKVVSHGGAFISLKEDGVRLLSFGGEDRGAFRIQDGKLHVKTEKIELDFFVSSIPEMTRKVFEDSMAEEMEEEEVSAVVSMANDKIVLKDEEEGVESVMTRVVKPSKPEPPKEDPTRRKGVKEDPIGERYRLFSMGLLEVDGFKAAKWLPTWKERSGVASELRKEEEILDRLMCSYAAVIWASVPEESVPSDRLRALIEANGLKEHLTEKEKEILGTDRKEAGEKFLSSVGWQMENMWALAWVVGFEEVPDIDQDQVGEETIGAMFQFLAPSWADKEAYLKKLKIRNLNEVVQMEDVFYCAHNAVRSAQTGKKESVPEGFHPILHGGIIHEKRHALTWVLSPGVAWEDTDLST